MVATVAFIAYTRTLLPGVDLGDTGGFQAAVLWPDVSARQAYPLYYYLARPFVRLSAPDNPARALNLFSAVTAALAVGLLTVFTARVARSLLAGAAAGLLFAFSYTFWTQAIIAEVYGLHLALVAASLLALHAYDRRPSLIALGVFFAVYAVAFGNHLSMVLWLAPLAAFLLCNGQRRAMVLRPTSVALAAAIAAAAALQYLPNFLAAWYAEPPSAGVADRIAAFWVDTTKADWRESMVLGVDPVRMPERLPMWWFDMRQQFGVAGIAAAAIGLVALWHRARAWAGLLLGAFAFNAAFALTYNVGDVHVFFLPAHFVMAITVGVLVGEITKIGLTTKRTKGTKVVSTKESSGSVNGPRTPALATLRVLGLRGLRALRGLTIFVVFALLVWRAWDTFPAVDRSRDDRAERLVGRLAPGAGDRDAVLVSGADWQIDNALLYASRWERPDLAWIRAAAVVPHFQTFVQDNHRIDRDVLLTAEAAATLVSAYGQSLPLVEDPVAPVPGLSEIGDVVPRGAPYVLAILTPPRGEQLDQDVLAAAIDEMTGGRAPSRTPAAFEVMAGLAGEAPVFYRAGDRPFRETFTIVDNPFTLRLDAWLPFDTFRRAGFGHVLRGRERALILERGFNLVWFEPDGSPSTPFYAAGLYAAKPRFRIPRATVELATRPGSGTLHLE